ncbi:hypothetical protein cypCar_00046665 [Cyprinus carpio]|nr:hypothetical protein cypCar_00046665 [Cyprinus carpio]
MANPCNIAADLKKYIVKEAPPTIYYVPNFITEAEEEYLLQQVDCQIPKGMLAEKLPDWLLKYTEKISALGTFAGKTANHVLVNEYKPGEGIMPHEDGPLYHPTVTTLSLGSHTLLDFYKPVCQTQDDMYKFYLHGIHGVCEDILSEHVVDLSSTGAQVGNKLPRGTRVSLTIRHVPKVIWTNLLLGKK